MTQVKVRERERSEGLLYEMEIRENNFVSGGVTERLNLGLERGDKCHE